MCIRLPPDRIVRRLIAPRRPPRARTAGEELEAGADAARLDHLIKFVGPAAVLALKGAEQVDLPPPRRTGALMKGSRRQHCRVSLLTLCAMTKLMLAIPLDTATEARLASAAARLGEEPHALAARAVGRYLEDLEDYARAAEAWAELDLAAVTSLADMKVELGLEG